MKVLNEGLRVLVANYIRHHREMHDKVLSSVNDYEDIEKYCSKIEQGQLWGSEPELKVLSSLYNILVCIIDLTKISKDNRVLS